ncbi:hypothetical protein AB0C77_13195 [Streptomyces sp. NPDC048629]|uniref:hypothetical protein n=1 Tax=Streptomyces sp. NPDC048629 TaxID=3154824 RepID=UPI003440F7A8
MTIAPCETALGYVCFKAPTASRITKIQFTMESGFADNTANGACRDRCDYGF